MEGFRRKETSFVPGALYEMRLAGSNMYFGTFREFVQMHQGEKLVCLSGEGAASSADVETTGILYIKFLGPHGVGWIRADSVWSICRETQFL